ncbi:MAG: dihydrofolate reductase [Planctomycetaceae bacterium]|nr:MAG: dihydrofolate reductase [Planctomycetaceae bacterium]
MSVSLIVAMSENRVIGRAGQLPWRLSSDLRRFRRLTMGHHLVMGRKTWESIGRPLPGRTSLVLTGHPDYRTPGACIVPDLPSAIRAADGDDEVFVIGGGQIYREALPLVDRIYMTLVHAHVDGDTVFPELDAQTWYVVERSARYPADQKNQYEHSFLIYQRNVTQPVAAVDSAQTVGYPT